MASDHVQILTFKDGLLSRVAHDLRLTLRSFNLEVDGDQLVFEARVADLEVEGAMEEGRLIPGKLSEKDKQEITRSMLGEVLDARRHPSVRFEGELDQDGDEIEAVGALELHGQRRELTLHARVLGDRVQGRVELQPSRWGIKPFKALMGALKVQDRVEVLFDLPHRMG